MHDISAMGMVDRAGQFLDQRGGLTRRLRHAAEPFPQTPTVHQFQSKILSSFVASHLVDLHDVGMAEPRHRLGFRLKPRLVLAAPAGTSEEDFQVFRQNIALQHSLGLEVCLLSPQEAKEVLSQINM